MGRLNRTFLLKAWAYKCYRVGLSTRGRLSKGWGTGERLCTGKNARIPQERGQGWQWGRKWCNGAEERWDKQGRLASACLHGCLPVEGKPWMAYDVQLAPMETGHWVWDLGEPRIPCGQTRSQWRRLPRQRSFWSGTVTLGLLMDDQFPPNGGLSGLAVGQR